MDHSIHNIYRHFVHWKLLTILTTRTCLFVIFCTPQMFQCLLVFFNPVLFLANYFFEIWVSFLIHFHIQTGTGPDFFKWGEKRRLPRKKNWLKRVDTRHKHCIHTKIKQTQDSFPLFLFCFFWSCSIALFYVWKLSWNSVPPPYSQFLSELHVVS